MSEDNKWTRSTRKTVVLSSTIRDLSADQFLKPKLEHLSSLPADAPIRNAIENDLPIWGLTTFYRTGLDQEGSKMSWHVSEEAAVQSMQPEGAVIDVADFMRPSSVEFVVGSICAETYLTAWGMRGEAPYELIYEALHGAGVYHNFDVSPLVLAWIGDAGKIWFEEEYGENWHSVVLLEYCLAHFGSDALATLAARILVSEFIANNDFDAGYASRELIMLASGAEEVALKSRANQEKRAREGGRASSVKKAMRLSMYMDEIEKLSPLVEMISEDRVLSQAWDNLKKEHSDWPVTPKVRFDYEVELRSTEPNKSRYNLFFGKSA